MPARFPFGDKRARINVPKFNLEIFITYEHPSMMADWEKRFCIERIPSDSTKMAKSTRIEIFLSFFFRQKSVGIFGRNCNLTCRSNVYSTKLKDQSQNNDFLLFLLFFPLFPLFLTHSLYWLFSHSKYHSLRNIVHSIYEIKM